VQEIIGKRWIEVDPAGDVILHHTATQIVAEVERNLRHMFGGVNATSLESDDGPDDDE
jgi:hypothetical protein